MFLLRTRGVLERAVLLNSVNQRPSHHSGLSIAITILVSCLLPRAAVAQLPSQVLDAALAALARGDTEAIVSLFHYFDGERPLEEASKDKQGIRTYFQLLREYFGRPERFEPIQVTAPNFINIFIESASHDLWRNSHCLFKEYAFKTTF